MDQDWELKYVSESPKRGLYTTIYIDIQLKNTKTQGQGEVHVFGSRRYMERADIHADIH
uniref:Uncharacterized protein n=1 Tax=Solanum tuberosum TaxID=4113 RepID=M1AZC4_SOLTU